MVIKRRWKIKEQHIYLATVVNTSVVSLITLHLTNGCLASLAIYAGVGSTLVMIVIANIFNDRIERIERKNGEKDEGKNKVFYRTKRKIARREGERLD